MWIKCNPTDAIIIAVIISHILKINPWIIGILLYLRNANCKINITKDAIRYNIKWQIKTEDKSYRSCLLSNAIKHLANCLSQKHNSIQVMVISYSATMHNLIVYLTTVQSASIQGAGSRRVGSMRAASGSVTAKGIQL